MHIERYYSTKICFWEQNFECFSERKLFFLSPETNPPQEENFL